jgi:hypothetical protein
MRIHNLERSGHCRPTAAALLALLALLTLPGASLAGVIHPSPRVVIGELLSQDG